MHGARSEQNGWFVQFKSCTEGWNLLITINIVDRRSKEAIQTYSLTWGTASVRVEKGKWIILHLEHEKKRGVVWGAEGEIVKEGRKRDRWAATLEGDAPLVFGSRLQFAVNNSHYQLNS